MTATTGQTIVVQQGGSVAGELLMKQGMNLVMTLIIAAVCRYQDLDWTWTMLVSGVFFLIIASFG